jgi:coenzyme F420-reducing hydrogenase beta subunit
MKISIIGPTISGNKGASAMFESAVQTISERFPETEYILLSYYPKKDKLRNKFKNVKVLSASPLYLGIILVPLSILYAILNKFGLAFLIKNREIKEIGRSDLILDLSRIAFVDGREKYLPFNVSIVLLPIIMSKRIVKGAQALGPFKNPVNRFFAKLILPRIDLIIARGKKTKKYLDNLAFKNTVLGVDYAFALKVKERDKKYLKKFIKKNKKFFNNHKGVVGISPSVVIEKYFKKNGRSHLRILKKFINYLIDQGYSVLLIPHSIRPNSSKTKNNDLLLCQQIRTEFKDNQDLIMIDQDFSPTRLKALIGCCDLYIASRFHSMISSLSMQVPTIVIGWSHKYKEVLETFELQNYAIDHKKLSLKMLKEKFLMLKTNRNVIRKKIKKTLPDIKIEAKKHVDYIEKIAKKRPGKFKLGKYNDESRKYYLGNFLNSYVGYSKQKEIRNGAASGGITTSILNYLLKSNAIDGALVTTRVTENKEVKIKHFIATSKEELMKSKTSTYIDSNLFPKMELIKNFQGKLAIVALPCEISVLKNMLNSDQNLANKIYLLIGLFCGHASKKNLLTSFLKKKGIEESRIENLIFATGHWRGEMRIKTEDKTFSYSKNNFGTYQNLYIDTAEKCLYCTDLTSEAADISIGDIWDYEYKQKDIKHNAILIRSKKADSILKKMGQENLIHVKEVHPEKIFNAQSRTLRFRKHIKARADLMNFFDNKKIEYSEMETARWNDYLLAGFTLLNIRLANIPFFRKIIFLLPTKLLYLYLVFLKGLASF